MYVLCIVSVVCMVCMFVFGVCDVYVLCVRGLSDVSYDFVCECVVFVCVVGSICVWCDCCMCG